MTPAPAPATRPWPRRPSWWPDWPGAGSPTGPGLPAPPSSATTSTQPAVPCGEGVVGAPPRGTGRLLPALHRPRHRRGRAAPAQPPALRPGARGRPHPLGGLAPAPVPDGHGGRRAGGGAAGGHPGRPAGGALPGPGHRGRRPRRRGGGVVRRRGRHPHRLRRVRPRRGGGESGCSGGSCRSWPWPTRACAGGEMAPSPPIASMWPGGASSSTARWWRAATAW